jgi:hypothetical protein
MEEKTRICVQKHLPRDRQYINHIKKTSLSAIHTQKLHAGFIASKVWPAKSKIRIGFIESENRVQWTSKNLLEKNGKELDPISERIRKMDRKDAVKTVVKERIIPIVNLDIQFVDDINDANVRVAFEDDGAWAYIGTDHLEYTDKTKPTVNFGWLDSATIMHEFGHMLAMIHEHSNPRGKSIDWDKPKAYAYFEDNQSWSKKDVDTNVFNHYNLNTINGSNFDPLSIMLYFFPGSITLNNQGTEQNLRLSGYDVEWINKMYSNSPETADQFYQDVYGMSIEEAIRKSDKSMKKFLSSGIPGGVWGSESITGENSGIWIGMLLAIIVVLGIIVIKKRR